MIKNRKNIINRHLEFLDFDSFIKYMTSDIKNSEMDSVIYTYSNDSDANVLIICNKIGNSYKLDVLMIYKINIETAIASINIMGLDVFSNNCLVTTIYSNMFDIEVYKILCTAKTKSLYENIISAIDSYYCSEGNIFDTYEIPKIRYSSDTSNILDNMMTHQLCRGLSSDIPFFIKINHGNEIVCVIKERPNTNGQYKIRILSYNMGKHDVQYIIDNIYDNRYFNHDFTNIRDIADRWYILHASVDDKPEFVFDKIIEALKTEI